MLQINDRPRITDYATMTELVIHLRKEGVDDHQMAHRLTQIGTIDLDVLNVVLRAL